MFDRKAKNIDNQRHPKVWEKATAIAAGVLILAACGNNDTKADGPTGSQPVATETAPSTTTQDITTSPNPTIESSAPTSEVETPDTSMGISADRYKTPEQVGERFGKVVGEWYNSGSASDVMDQAIHGAGVGAVEQVSDEAAAKLDEQYLSSLFDPKAQNDPKTAAAIAGMQESHKDTLYRKTLTTDSFDSRDKQPYARTFEIISVSPISSDSTTITMTVKYHESDNADQNRIGTQYGAGKLDTDGSVNLTFTKTGDQWLVSSANFTDTGKQ